MRIACAAAVALSACMPLDAGPDAPLPPPPDFTQEPRECGAPFLQHLVGRDRSVLAEMRFAAERVRVIRPGMAVTMDYSPDRLNILLDGRGRIVRVSCG